MENVLKWASLKMIEPLTIGQTFGPYATYIYNSKIKWEMIWSEHEKAKIVWKRAYPLASECTKETKLLKNIPIQIPP